MTSPGVGQLTALAFVAAIDDASRIRRSRDNDGAGAGTEY
jgi:transposase